MKKIRVSRVFPLLLLLYPVAQAFLRPPRSPTANCDNDGTRQARRHPVDGRLHHHHHQPQRHHLAPLTASSRGDDDLDDLTDRSLSFLGTLIKGLSRELPVPSMIIPPKANERGTQTTLQGWYVLSVGISLALGNPVYPSALLGFLYLSRPVEAPDWTAAIAAVFTSGIVSPLLGGFADATGLDDSFLARLPLVLGIFVSGAVLKEILQESDKSFVAPRKEEDLKIPGLKSERDLRFYDVKLQNRSSGQESELAVEVKEKMGEAAGAIENKAKEVGKKVESAVNKTSDAFAKVLEND